MSCLVDHRGNISEYQCNQYITKMTSIVFSDYHLICGFMNKCRDDINSLHCGSINTGEKVLLTSHYDYNVLYCSRFTVIYLCVHHAHLSPSLSVS